MFYEFLLIGSNKSAASLLFDREAAVVMCALRRTSLKDFKIYINSNSISFFKKNFFTISSHSRSRVLSIIKLLKEVPVTQVR